MKIFIRSAAAALVVSLIGVSGAEAQLQFGYSVGPLYGNVAPHTTDYYAGAVCTSADVAGSIACDGWFTGNNEGASPPPSGLVLEHINYLWASEGLGTVTSGTTTQTNLGSTGTINLAEPLTGIFAIAMKAGSGFMLALVDGGAGVSSINYNMTSSPFQGEGLSHYTIYGGGTVTVPEPSTLLLLATGLMGLALMARRRNVEFTA